MNRQRNLWPTRAQTSAKSGAKPRLAALRSAGARLNYAATALGHVAVALAQPVVDLLLPPRCVCCGAERDQFANQVLLCESCRKAFSDSVTTRCERCGAAAAGACPACRKRPPRFERLIALGPYAGELRATVLRLKRPGQEALATAMGQLLAERLLSALTETDQPLDPASAQVTPTPMHWLRRVAQQANSPDLLAGALATRLSLHLADTFLVRNRNTRKQGPMLRTERLTNVRGAFSLRPGARVEGAHVILVDDVVTTGATCDEIARVLHRAGAKRVTVATLARADTPR